MKAVTPGFELLTSIEVELELELEFLPEAEDRGLVVELELELELELLPEAEGELLPRLLELGRLTIEEIVPVVEEDEAVMRAFLSQSTENLTPPDFFLFSNFAVASFTKSKRAHICVLISI